MNNLKLLTGLVLAILISGCGNSADEQYGKLPAGNDSTSPSVNSQVQESENTNQASDSNKATFTPNTEIKVAPVTVPASVPSTTNTTSKAGLNPEHGKPGHRCDIPVGSPLDSKPTTSTATTTTPISLQPQGIPAATPVINPTPAQSTGTVTTAPGMNPPHGQPGHRCDIPVGSPLSQPVKTGN